MVKIYSKAGDKGTTSLFGGKRVDKNSVRIKAYGEVDELNSLIGVILTDLEGVRPLLGVEPLKKKLLRLQSELFVLGSDLATSIELELKGKSKRVKVIRIKKAFVNRLEQEIDLWEKDLPPLKNFILPGGRKVGSKLHLARSVARRAERALVDLGQQEKINQNALVYLNRLSDWFFVVARYINKLEGSVEIIWRARNR